MLKTLPVPTTMRTLLLTGVIGLGLTSAAGAQVLYHGADGPVVLPTSPSSGRPVPDDPRAVPVPSVMNGSGFGLTGTDYYNDSLTEGPLNRRQRTQSYVLAPARIGPQDYRRPVIE